MGSIQQNTIGQRKKKMIEALTKTMGIVTTACKIVGIGRATFYEWVRDDEDFAKEVKSIGEIAVDYAESKLFENIKGKKETSIIFFLKTKAKHRGYIERTENVNVEKKDFSDLTDEELANKIKKTNDLLK